MLRTQPVETTRWVVSGIEAHNQIEHRLGASAWPIAQKS